MRIGILSDIHDPIETHREGGSPGVNPGEITGRLGPPTFALYDTETEELERHEL